MILHGTGIGKYCCRNMNWIINTIMGPSYVHQLLWGLTPVHKTVPIYIVSYVLLWVHLMYTNYCGVLLLYIRRSLYIYSRGGRTALNFANY